MTARTIRQHLLAFDDGSLAPVETVAAALSAVDHHNPALNAIPTLVNRADVLREAERISSSLRRGDAVGQLAGLPYVAKDTHRTAGVRTTWGSPIFASHVPDRNDPVVQRLLDADSVLLGKSNTPEFAAGSQTFNTLFGVTRNPYALDHTVGGSSGGAACALAAGMALVADGSDLAASLRNPASFCGVAGLRPSSWADPTLRNGLNAFSSLSMVGPLGRCVDDLRCSYRAIYSPAGRRPIKHWAAWLAQETTNQRRGATIDAQSGSTPRDPSGLRLAWSIDAGGTIPVAVPVHRAMRRVADRLRETGVKIVEASPDFAGADECFQTLRGLYFVENYAQLYATDRTRMKDTVLWNIEFGLELTAERIAAAGRLRSEVFQRMVDFMAGVDGWLLPTSQVLPFPHRVAYPTEINGEHLATYIDWLKSCYWVTISGHPAASIPCGFESDGVGPRLPIGLQVVGHWNQEESLFDVAETIETLLEPLNANRPALVTEAGDPAR